MKDKDWERLDAKAWNTAAAKLEAEGYTRRTDGYYPAVFCKDGEEVVLTRPLATHNWQPRAA